jgi:hypothetical protein
MPRPRNPANESGRQAQERYRDRLADKGQPEVDAVDTAVAVALAVYASGARDLKSPKDIARAESIEAMAVNYLIHRGSSLQEATRKVIARVRRLDVEKFRPLVKAPKKPSDDVVPVTRLF